MENSTPILDLSLDKMLPPEPIVKETLETLAEQLKALPQVLSNEELGGFVNVLNGMRLVINHENKTPFLKRLQENPAYEAVGVTVSFVNTVTGGNYSTRQSCDLKDLGEIKKLLRAWTAQAKIHGLIEE